MKEQNRNKSHLEMSAMPNDLVIFELFSILPAFCGWDILWRNGSIIAFLIGIVFEIHMIRGSKKRMNLFALLIIILIVVFCECMYQATPGFDAVIFAMAELLLLFILAGMALGAVIGLFCSKA